MFKKVLKEVCGQVIELLNELGAWAIRGAGFTIGVVAAMQFIN